MGNLRSQGYILVHRIVIGYINISVMGKMKPSIVCGNSQNEIRGLWLGIRDG